MQHEDVKNLQIWIIPFFNPAETAVGHSVIPEQQQSFFDLLFARQVTSQSSSPVLSSILGFGIRTHWPASLPRHNRSLFSMTEQSVLDGWRRCKRRVRQEEFNHIFDPFPLETLQATCATWASFSTLLLDICLNFPWYLDCFIRGMYVRMYRSG